MPGQPGVYIPCESNLGCTMPRSAGLKVLQIKENIHAGAFQVGFFTPGETKWRRRNVAISAFPLQVRGFLYCLPRAAQFSYIRLTVSDEGSDVIQVLTKL